MSNLRVSLSTYHENQKKSIEVKAIENEYRHLLDKASHQHHLMGTKSVPGIYSKTNGKIDETIFKENDGHKRWVNKHMNKYMTYKIPVKSTKSSMMKLNGELFLLVLTLRYE